MNIDPEILQKALQELEEERKEKKFSVNVVKMKYESLSKSYCRIPSLRKCLIDDIRFTFKMEKASLANSSASESDGGKQARNMKDNSPHRRSNFGATNVQRNQKKNNPGRRTAPRRTVPSRPISRRPSSSINKSSSSSSSSLSSTNSPQSLQSPVSSPPKKPPKRPLLSHRNSRRFGSSTSNIYSSAAKKSNDTGNQTQQNRFQKRTTNIDPKRINPVKVRTSKSTLKKVPNKPTIPPKKPIRPSKRYKRIIKKSVVSKKKQTYSKYNNSKAEEKLVTSPLRPGHPGFTGFSHNIGQFVNENSKKNIEKTTEKVKTETPSQQQQRRPFSRDVVAKNPHNKSTPPRPSSSFSSPSSIGNKIRIQKKKNQEEGKIYQKQRSDSISEKRKLFEKKGIFRMGSSIKKKKITNNSNDKNNKNQKKLEEEEEEEEEESIGKKNDRKIKGRRRIQKKLFLEIPEKKKIGEIISPSPTLLTVEKNWEEMMEHELEISDRTSKGFSSSPNIASHIYQFNKKEYNQPSKRVQVVSVTSHQNYFPSSRKPPSVPIKQQQQQQSHQFSKTPTTSHQKSSGIFSIKIPPSSKIEQQQRNKISNTTTTTNNNNDVSDEEIEGEKDDDDEDDEEDDELELALQVLKRVEERFVESLEQYEPLIQGHPLIGKILKVFEEEGKLTVSEYNEKLKNEKEEKQGRRGGKSIMGGVRLVGSLLVNFAFGGGGGGSRNRKFGHNNSNRRKNSEYFKKKMNAFLDSSKSESRPRLSVIERMESILNGYKQRGNLIDLLQRRNTGLKNDYERNSQSLRHVKSSRGGGEESTKTGTKSETNTESDTDTLSTYRQGGRGKINKMRKKLVQSHYRNVTVSDQTQQISSIRSEGVDKCFEYLKSDLILKKSLLIGLFSEDFREANHDDLVRHGKSERVSEEARGGLRSHKGTVMFILNTQFDIMFMGKMFSINSFPVNIMFGRELLVSTMMNTTKCVRSSVLGRVKEYEEFSIDVISPHQKSIQPSDFIVKCHGTKVEVVETNQDSANIWIIMEACDCCVQTYIKTRVDMLKQRKRQFPFSLREKFNIMYQMAICLYVLHRGDSGNRVNGIFHSDIKPGNFLVNKIVQNDVSFIRVKLCDFGLSLRKDETRKDGKILEEYRKYSTPGWVYVDRITGLTEEPSFARDICALGFCFGTVFFSNDSYAEPFKPGIKLSQRRIKKFMYSTEKKPFEQQFRQQTRYPPEFKELLVRMWNRNPSSRFSIDDVLDWFKRNSSEEWFRSLDWKCKKI